MSAKRYSPAIRARMAELRRQGWTQNAIALLFACSVRTVVYHCHQRGAEPPWGAVGSRSRRPDRYAYRPRETRP